MASQDSPFFFVRWGAHIGFLQDAIPQNRRCSETDAWLLPVLYFWGRLVGTRVGSPAGRGPQLVHRSTKIYLNEIFQDACPDSCARTIRATTYAAIFLDEW